MVLIKLLKKNPLRLVKVLECEYHQNMRIRWRENIFSEKKHFSVNSEKKLKRIHKLMAKQTRSSQYFRTVEGLAVEDKRIFEGYSYTPIIFEEIYSETPLFSEWDPEWFRGSSDKLHLFVMVHGFLGRSIDLKLFKDSISSFNPKAVFLMSKANEGKSHNDIEDMGKRLACEIMTYLYEYFADNILDSISFIGFSLGGVVIRAALPHLYEYKDKMKMFMTLNSPHLGCPSGDSAIVDAGRWVFMKMKKSYCLKQLSLRDHKDITKTFLYNLATAPGIEWFEYFIMLSCSQDKMVPFESARVEYGRHISGNHLSHMSREIFGRLENTNIVRVNCNFGKKIEKFMGRNAHLKVLESSAMQSLLLYRYAEAFF